MRSHRRMRTKTRYSLVTMKLSPSNELLETYNSKIYSTKKEAMKDSKEYRKQQPTPDYPYLHGISKLKPSAKTIKTEQEVKNILSMTEEQLRKKYKGKQLPGVIYHILEDMNAHSRNSFLVRLGVFGKPKRNFDKYTKKYYYTPPDKSYVESDKDWDQYRKEGGRSWD